MRGPFTHQPDRGLKLIVNRDYNVQVYGEVMSAIFDLLLFVFKVTSILLENILHGSLEYVDPEYERYTITLGPCFIDVYEPCSSGKILFYLYTRKTKENPVLMKISDKTPPPNYDWRAKTKVLIHGYAGSVDFNGTILIRKAYLEQGNYNIIVVDWGQLTKLPCYPAAVLNTWQAGRCTARLLENLTRLRMQNYDVGKIHAVGFSLGAHVAAFASNELKRKIGKRFGRITGLDPALPFFASLRNTWKLDKEDADFVDVIHTNAGIFGKIEPAGHADFYVNGGFSQPACFTSGNVPLCSHVMATVYYAESIRARRRGFWGIACESYLHYLMGWCNVPVKRRKRALMGDKCRMKSKGIYFVTTRNRPPYALG